MIVIGSLLALGSLALAYHLISLACPAGCETSLIRLISDMMIADKGIIFWLAWVSAVFLIWGGTRLKSR